MAAIKVPFLTRNKLGIGSRCTLVDSEEAFQQLVRVLKAHSLIALDTESNNFHSYAPRTCLVQFAVQSHPNRLSQGMFVFLLDPNRVNLRRLRPIFENPGKTFILHAASNDLGHLWKEFQIQLAQVFDTQIAARLIGMKRVSLAAILEKQFDVVQNKKPQTSDWGRRPFSQAQLSYACQDVAYLIPLYRFFLQALRSQDRLHEGLAIMEELARRDYSRFGTPHKTFWEHQTTKRVPIQLMNVYQSLWHWREEIARRLDCPRFKILGDKALLILTREQPADVLALKQCDCLTAVQLKTYGADLVEVIRRGQQERIPRPPRASATALPRAEERQQESLRQELRKWRHDTSRKRGIDSDFVLSKYTLEVIAKDAPDTLNALAQHKVLPNWKLQEYGQELIRIIRNMALSK